MKIQNAIGAVLILIGFALLWLSASYGYADFAFSAGRAVGQSMIIGLILLLIIALTPLRKKVALILVFGTVWIGSTGLMSFGLYQHGKEDREIGRAAIDIIDSISAGNVITYDENTYGDDSLDGWFKGYASRSQKVHNDLNNEINSLELGDILLPMNLKNTRVAEQGRAKIAQLEQSIPDYEERILDEIYLAEKTLAARNDDQGQAAYRGFMRTKEKGVQLAKRYFEVQKKLVGAIADILDLSIRLEGKLNVVQGQLMFEDQESLDLYNGYIMLIDSLSKEESEILLQAQQGLDETKTNINNLIKDN